MIEPKFLRQKGNVTIMINTLKRLIKLIYKFCNLIYSFFLKKGICGLMCVFVEEDLIVESINSCISFLNKLVLIIDTNLECYKKVINNIKCKKMKIIKINNPNKHYSKYFQKGYKKCHYKCFAKIDADQIYFNNFNDAIKKCINEKKIVFTSGINVFKGCKFLIKPTIIKTKIGGVNYRTF